VDGDWVCRRFDAEHASHAACWADMVEQDPDGGRLACAVGPKEAHDLAGVHAQVDVDYATMAAVILGQPLRLDDGFHAHLLDAFPPPA
jgi:hypothetical protein